MMEQPPKLLLLLGHGRFIFDASDGDMFNPVSSQGKAISDFMVLTLSIGLFVTLLVSGLVTWAVIKYRRTARTTEGEPKQFSGNLRLEIGWTLVPALLLVVLSIITLDVMAKSDPTVPDQAQPDIVLTGWQWWWEYSYPKLNIITANELHIPQGKQLLLQMTGGDVIHDFWIPALGRKKDMLPGQINKLYIQSDKVGTYLGACAEYCGGNHAWMLLKAIVEPEAQFNTWAQSQSKPVAAPTDPALVKGSQVFLNNTCVSCHAIAGTTAQAKVGPNLSHLGGRTTLGAGVIDNNPDNLRNWIKNAASYKPGIQMPAYQQLTEDDLQALVKYLEALK